MTGVRSLTNEHTAGFAGKTRYLGGGRQSFAGVSLLLVVVMLLVACGEPGAVAGHSPSPEPSTAHPVAVRHPDTEWTTYMGDAMRTGVGPASPQLQAGKLHRTWTAAVDGDVYVACTAYRSPGVRGKLAVTIDELSGGRLILGLGAGWHDEEYIAFGYPTDHNVSRFSEAMVLSGLLAGEAVTYNGRFYQTSAAELLPRPARPIPILVAGTGPRMLSLTAQYASAWNTAWFLKPNERFDRQLADMETALRDKGLDRADMQVTVGILIRDAEAAAAAGRVKELVDVWAARADELILYLLPSTIRALENVMGVSQEL